MIVVKIFSGLGNQLFQFAAGLHLAKTLNTKLYLDLSAYEGAQIRSFGLRKLGIPYQEASSLRIKLFPKKLSRYQNSLGCLLKLFPFQYFYEEDPNINIEIPIKNNLYLDGYFQFYYHILPYKSFILELLQPKLKKYVYPLTENQISVSVHVRRGDYINNPIFHELSVSYYDRAIAYSNEFYYKLGFVPKYYFFSDDITWVEDTFSNLPVAKQFIKSTSDIEDFMLMLTCQGSIIPNSTFSWWPAFLSEGKDKLVILPTYWFKNQKSDNFALNEWVRLDN